MKTRNMGRRARQRRASQRHAAARRLLVAVFIGAVVGLSRIALAGWDFLNEEKALKVVAAFLYNFGKFVHWPESALSADDGPVVIAVLGDDPFGALLDRTMRDKTVHGRHIEVQRLDWFVAADRDAMRHAQVAFIASSEANRLEAILAALGGRAVLTVSVIPGFTERGGMIGLFLEDGRIQFEINRRALEATGLRAGAELLRLAREPAARR